MRLQMLMSRWRVITSSSSIYFISMFQCDECMSTWSNDVYWNSIPTSEISLSKLYCKAHNDFIHPHCD
ncbi:hypothetical protein Plhal304r1_c013g0050401 [Plasmopara halstedii]